MSQPHPRSVLETDFPLMTPPNPPAGSNPTASPSSASYAAGRPSYQQYRYQRTSSSGYNSSSSLQRSQITTSATSPPAGAYRPLSAYYSPYSRAHSTPANAASPTVAGAASTTTPSAAAATEWQYQSVGSTGRSGSLKRAYDANDASAGGRAEGDETQPLFPKEHSVSVVAPVPATVGGDARPSPSSTTSDYHSDTVVGGIAEDKKEPIERALTKRQNSAKAKNMRHRKHDDEGLSGCARCCFGLFVLVAQILLNGAMALCLYWIIQFHNPDNNLPFAWRSNPRLQFNLHPVLMIAGFIYFMGQAMLIYRTCRCCRRLWNKLLHTVFHILAIPCVAVGFLAVLDFHDLRQDQRGNPAPVPHFYSLHSWMGLATMGLFALQFIVGFFSFLLLLCCESATASFRAALVPIHATVGTVTFILAVATACAGLTEKAFFELSVAYSMWVPSLFDRRFNATTALAGLTNLGPEYTQSMLAESLTINVLGATLVLLALVVPFVVSYPRFSERTLDADEDKVVYNIADLYRRWPSADGWQESLKEGEFDHPMPEGLLVNALGATLIALAVVMPLIVVGCNRPFRRGLQREDGRGLYDDAL